MWLLNLVSFSLQVAILISAGTALVYLFRLKAPAVLLAFWQALVAVSLLLPVLQPWQQVRQPVLSAPQEILENLPLSVLSDPDSGIKMSASADARPVRFPTYTVVAFALVAGIILRLLWLALGLLRLRRYLGRSRQLAALPESIREMQWSIGVAPDIFFSPDIDSPVTFGWHRPAVLFPDSFIEMSAGMQRSIACHELLHVERRDWVFIVMEELLRSLLWFHPAVWWALSRIHLSREQVVDRRVLKITGERGPYLESLLHIASLRGRPAAVPAPLLLREHHLVQRVALMIKESKMTRTRLIVSLVAIAAFLLWTGTYAAAWFPLIAPAVPTPTVPMASSSGSSALAARAESMPAAAPAVAPAPVAKQEPEAAAQEPLRVGANVQASKLVHKVDPVYPELARRARVEQIVMLEALVDAQGNVANLRVIKGHPLLDQAAIEAVRQWRYAPTLLNGQPVSVVATVTVTFSLSSDSARAAEFAGMGGIIGGAPASTGGQGGIVGGAPPPPSPKRVEPLRVGGNVQESKIIKRVDPIYPELAKRARVEQIVMLEVTVNEEGLVSNVRVIRGHPLLDQAAIDAVKQWVYAPTLLNGQAVPVIATVTVVFSLSQRFTLDADGYIRDSNGAIVSVAAMRDIRDSIQLTPAAQTSYEQIQQTMAYLQAQGVENVRLNSQSFVYASGRLFYQVPSITLMPQGGMFVAPVEIPRSIDQADQIIQAPALSIDADQLVKLAEGSGRLPEGSRSLALTFTVFVDETGQIVDVQGPGGTLDIPEVTTALKTARVSRPGLRGRVPVPTALRVVLRLNRQ